MSRDNNNSSKSRNKNKNIFFTKYILDRQTDRQADRVERGRQTDRQADRVERRTEST